MVGKLDLVNSPPVFLTGFQVFFAGVILASTGDVYLGLFIVYQAELKQGYIVKAKAMLAKADT